jgi:hypothetical protein
MPTLLVRDAVTSAALLSTPLDERSARHLMCTTAFRTALAAALYPRAFGPSGDALHLEVEGDSVPVRGRARLVRQSRLSPRHDWAADDTTQRDLVFEIT